MIICSNIVIAHPIPVPGRGRTTFFVGSKHIHQKDVNEDSFTECPGEGSQVEVVQEDCHNLTGILVKEVKGKICQYGL